MEIIFANKYSLMHRTSLLVSQKTLIRLFGDNMIANAILDRLLHHSHVINITGKSYRTKDIISSTSDEVND